MPPKMWSTTSKCWRRASTGSKNIFIFVWWHFTFSRWRSDGRLCRIRYLQGLICSRDESNMRRKIPPTGWRQGLEWCAIPLIYFEMFSSNQGSLCKRRSLLRDEGKKRSLNQGPCTQAILANRASSFPQRTWWFLKVTCRAPISPENAKN